MAISLHPIRTERDYEEALDELEGLMSSVPGTPEFDRLECLSILIEHFEQKYHPIPPPDPIEAIKFRMEQQGLTKRDLESILGSRGRVSEILNRRRSLSPAMMRRLHDKLGVPAESLIGASISSEEKVEEVRDMAGSYVAMAELRAKIASEEAKLPDNKLWRELGGKLGFQPGDLLRMKESIHQDLTEAVKQHSADKNLALSPGEVESRARRLAYLMLKTMLEEES